MTDVQIGLLIAAASLLGGGLTSFAVVSIRIGKYVNKLDNACTDVGDLKKEMKEIRDKAVAAETLLKERGPLTKTKSPISLTERGQKVLADSGGQKFIDDNYVDFKSQIESKKPETSYDVQEMAKAVVEGLREDVRFNPLKEYLFKEGLSVEDIVSVLGIYLRDRVLADKEWKTEDIDKYDPAKNGGESEAK